MLLIGAFVLLSTLTLGVNTTIINTTTMGLEMEANLNALSYAQSMMDEIQTRAFDQVVTNGKRVFTDAAMTSTGSFGPGGTEVISGVDSSRNGIFLSQTKFNDVDDYHNYERWVWNDRLGWFIIKDTVKYVDEDNLTEQYAKSWHKKIIVNVQNFSMTKDVNGNIIPYRLMDVAVYRKYY